MKKKTWQATTIIVILLLFSLYFTGTPTAVAKGKETVKEYWSNIGIVAVIVKKTPSRIQFWARNTATYNITITLNIKNKRNLKADKWFLPVTNTVAPKQDKLLLTLTRINRNKPTNYGFRYQWMTGKKGGNHEWFVTYRLPYESGKSFKVIQGYNGRFSHFGNNKNATDWGMPVGTRLLATRDGTVVGIKEDSNMGGTDNGMKRHGNFIIIRHKDGTYAEYYHLKQNGAKVKVGQRVKAGQFIGLSGNTGYSTCPHLHFCVYKVVDGGNRKTYAVKFKTARHGKATLKQNVTYTAP